jgi:succinyl-CoA synthetase beta subunit
VTRATNTNFSQTPAKQQRYHAFLSYNGDEKSLVKELGMECNTIATGVVAAARDLGLKIPLVVRLEGNNVAAGKQTLAESGLKIESATTMADAAQKIVKLVA